MSRVPMLERAEPVEWEARGDFVEWLADCGATLAVTTYNAGKLILLEATAPEGLRQSCWKLPRPMGLAVDGMALAIAVREQIVWCAPCFAADDAEGSLVRADWKQVAARTVGRLDVHDLAVGRRGLHFMATKFNCLARPSDRVQFTIVWRPPFMTEVVPRDCCHLNGLGMDDGRPALVTAFCESPLAKGWRSENRFRSGVAMELPSGRVVARGLNMPHSPRRYADRWWLANSGEGTLCQLEEGRLEATVVAAAPGFTRGLTFAADRAVVGRSRIRNRHILDAPPVRQRWGALQAGVSLIDVQAGRETGGIDFLRGGREVYETAVISSAEREAWAARLLAP